MNMPGIRGSALAAAVALALLSASTFSADAPATRPLSPSGKPLPTNLPPPPPGMFPSVGRAITHVTGDLYRASNNGGWYVGILDTPDGLLLVDTLSVPYAKWLKEELAKKFPGKQVKYVILSHSHWDHTEGGKIFADTARFIAQEGFLRNTDGRYPALPGDIVDRNNDGILDPIEFDQPGIDRPWYCGGTGAVTVKDKNGDGHVTPAEFFADTPRPDIVYSERMTLLFGGKTIDLVFPGKNHANDGTAVLFRDERTLFTTDFPADALVQNTMRSMPSACGPFDGHSMDEWIKSYRTIEALDFDISVGGHGGVPFTKKDIAEGRGFFEYLKHAVQTAMSTGMSLDQMRKTIMLEPYKDWRHYEQLRVPNIEAAYYSLKTFK